VTRTPLTPIEEQVYHFLLDFLADRTFQPSVREIAERFRIASTKSVADLLASLERKGYIAREAGRSRGVTLLGFAGGAGTVPVPIMRPDGEQRAMIDDGYLTLDRSLIAVSDAFLARAFPHSAPESGVFESDLVIVHPSERARDGDTVVVRVGGAVLVRAMHRIGSNIRLAPSGEQPTLELGPADDYAVLGVLGGVIRTSVRA
jgi:repressor LexA